MLFGEDVHGPGNEKSPILVSMALLLMVYMIDLYTRSLHYSNILNWKVLISSTETIEQTHFSHGFLKAAFLLMDFHILHQLI